MYSAKMKNFLIAAVALLSLALCGAAFAADISELTAAADAGDAEAQYFLGIRYENGTDVEQDFAKAAEWYAKAAEQGHVWAQNRLGVMYENGDGVEQDYAKAVEWYTKAAEDGYAEAQYRLGDMYVFGDGIANDPAKAIEWYTKAAEQGYVLAQSGLGVIYERGELVEQDLSAAYMWCLVATMTDPDEGRERVLAAIGEKLTAEQIKEAESKAKAKFEEIEKRNAR